MRHPNKSGYLFYATALAGFGVIQLVTHNFLTGLLPVPAGLFFRFGWMCIVSIIFLVSATGIFFNFKRPVVAALAGMTFLIFFLLLHLPILFSDIYNGSKWTATFETLALGSGAFIIACRFSKEASANAGWNKRLYSLCTVSRYLFAISLLVFGILHIKYVAFIQTLIPSWMPAHVLLSYLVTAGFLLTCISLFTGFKTTLACNLLGSMFLLWVLLLHGPRVAYNTTEPELSSLFVALAMSGIAFTIADLRLDKKTTVK